MSDPLGKNWPTAARALTKESKLEEEVAEFEETLG